MTLIAAAVALTSGCGGAGTTSGLIPSYSDTGDTNTGGSNEDQPSEPTDTDDPIDTTNLAPIEPSGFISINEDQSLTAAAFLSHFDDPEGDSLTLLNMESSTAEVAADASGRLALTPPTDFFGTIEASYTVTDGVNELSSSISIMVHPINDAPLTQNDAYELLGNGRKVALDVLENDIDPDGDQLTITGVSSESGTVEILNNQIFYRSANGFLGEDEVAYTVEDGYGGESNASAIIEVTEASSRFVYLSWAPPTKRENGLELFEFEIYGYEIVYSSNQSETTLFAPADQHQDYEIELSREGTYSFQLVTIDQDGNRSQLSDPLEFTLTM